MNFVDTLLRRLWITKKARMEASARLERRDSWSQNVQIWYTYIITALSIWIFYIEKSNKLSTDSHVSTILLLASIFLSILSTFILSKSYKERAIKMRHNYNEIDKLHSKLSRENDAFCANITSSEALFEAAHKISEEYNTILSTIENHTVEDYLNVLWNDKNEKMSWTQLLLFFYYKIVFFTILAILLIILPSVVIYFCL